MTILLVVILLLVVVIFGAASIMQSHAAAKQAEAVIETAQAAQMATLGNVAIIFLLVIVVLALLGLAVFVFLFLRRMQMLPPNMTRVRAGESISAGDIVFMGADGRARKFPQARRHGIKLSNEDLQFLSLALTDNNLKRFEEEIALWDAASDEDEEAWR
jgi:hypothetical protein